MFTFCHYIHSAVKKFEDYDVLIGSRDSSGLGYISSIGSLNYIYFIIGLVIMLLMKLIMEL